MSSLLLWQLVAASLHTCSQSDNFSKNLQFSFQSVLHLEWISSCNSGSSWWNQNWSWSPLRTGLGGSWSVSASDQEVHRRQSPSQYPGQVECPLQRQRKMDSDWNISICWASYHQEVKCECFVDKIRQTSQHQWSEIFLCQAWKIVVISIIIQMKSVFRFSIQSVL